MQLLRDMNRELNTTFLIVTHDLQIAKQCQRIISMSDGLVVNDQRKPGTEEE
jgi:putative ABC transport system ATP-binding protein